LLEYVERHSPDEVTEALDRVIARIGDGSQMDGFAREAARRALESSEW